MNVRPSVFPLNNADQQSVDAQKSAASLTERYKNLLGFQAAGQDVGLFYQLNTTAEATESEQRLAGLNNGNDSNPDYAPKY